jgi:hypothetical protein
MKCKYEGVVCYFPNPEDARAFERERQWAGIREAWNVRAWKPEAPGPCRQKPLFTGLNCLSGQANLLETTG